MHLLARQIETAASCDLTAVVTGESGTGKELVARALHTQSARADMPFISINCGAITESLMEAELFGYERGAFTGALAEISLYSQRCLLLDARRIIPSLFVGLGMFSGSSRTSSIKTARSILAKRA